MELKEFGLNLAKFRMAKNLSAYELSLQIGKSPNYIHRVETGQNNLSIKTMLEICKHLEIEPHQLFKN